MNEEAATEVFYKKGVATLLKKESGTGFFLRVLQNF